MLMNIMLKSNIKISTVLTRRKIEIKKIRHEILSFVPTWMGLENIMLSEISQSEKAKNHMWDMKLKLTNTDSQQHGGYHREGR